MKVSYIPVFLLALLCSIAAMSPASGRIFTNKKGKKLDAEVVSKTETQVKLRTEKGKVYEIALDTLSEADQDYIRSWKDDAARKSELAGLKLGLVMEAKGYTRVEFDEEMNHLFVDARINGKDVRLLLDTGAMVTIIKTGSVKKLGLEMKEANVQAGGVGGGAQIKGRVDVEKLEMGGDNAGNQAFYVMDLNHLPQNYATKMDGILGGDFFKSKKSLFDYAGGILWVKLK